MTRARPAKTKGAVDWGEVRHRIEAAGAALTGEPAVDPERLRQVLEERARTLARPARPPAQDMIELITFTLTQETYAIESRYVFEVFRLGELSPLPGAKPPVFGITPWRGALLTILDLRRALGVSAAGLDDLNRVIVIGSERPSFGILADGVRELVRVPTAAVRVPPEGVAVRREYLRGVTADAVLVLEGEKLLALQV